MLLLLIIFFLISLRQIFILLKFNPLKIKTGKDLSEEKIKKLEAKIKELRQLQEEIDDEDIKGVSILKFSYYLAVTFRLALLVATGFYIYNMVL